MKYGAEKSTLGQLLLREVTRQFSPGCIASHRAPGNRAGRVASQGHGETIHCGRPLTAPDATAIRLDG